MQWIVCPGDIKKTRNMHKLEYVGKTDDMSEKRVVQSQLRVHEVLLSSSVACVLITLAGLRAMI